MKLGRIPASLLFGATVLISIGCDSFNGSSYRITGIEVVSAVPAHIDGEGFVHRQCLDDVSRPVNALQFSFSLSGVPYIQMDAQVQRANRGAGSNREPVFPGDLVTRADGGIVEIAEPGADVDEYGKVRPILPEDVYLKAECLSPHPIARLSPECVHAVNSVLRGQNVDFHVNDAKGLLRSQSGQSARSIAILVDQSGSMGGFVEPMTGMEYSQDLQSAAGGKAPISVNGYSGRASDYQSFRASAVQALMSLLEPGDRAGVFVFGESLGTDQARILSDDDYWDEEKARNAEFGTGRQVLRSAALAELQGSARGRTPLWSAVRDVYDFLKNSEDTSNRHLVVITDGPDTCSPDSPDFAPLVPYFRLTSSMFETGVQGACSDTSSGDFMDIVLADTLDGDGIPKPAGQIPVHVSFIQMQSMGYREIDVAQQQVACLTGGHYFWINSSGFPPSATLDQDALTRWDGVHPMQDALRRVAVLLSFSLSGTWAATFKVPGLEMGSERSFDVHSDTGVTTDLDKSAHRSGSTCADPVFDKRDIIGRTSMSFEGKMGPAFSDMNRTLINPDSVESDSMFVDNGIDYRPTFYFPDGLNAPSCGDWFPLCSVAAEMAGEMMDADGAAVARMDKSVECMLSEPDANGRICRAVDSAHGMPCSAGLCCRGQCLSPPHETIWYKLGEDCNWVLVSSH